MYYLESIDKQTSLQVTPNWLGTFYTTSECDTNKCCCIYGLITLSKMKPNYLRFESLLVGYDCPTDHIDSTITMPRSFQTEFLLSIGQVDITLSDDSHIINLYYQRAPQCNGRAIRNNAKSLITIYQIKFVLIIFFVKNKFY